MIRFGVTPEINAIATVVLVVSLALVFAALLMLVWVRRKSPKGAGN